MKTVDIILPVYNEEPGIGLFHQELGKILDTLSARYRFHLIYVVDPSKDRSFGVLKELASAARNISVLHFSRRFGHQMSLVAGMDHARGDAVIMMDSDLQHPPELIPVLLEEFEKGHDVVHTVRQYADSASFLKRFTSNLFYRFQNLLSPVDIPPGVADFRLISRKVVAHFQQNIREHNQFLRGLFQWIGFNRTYVPFQCKPRVAGRTKYTVGRLLLFFSDGIVSFSRVPLQAAILIGLIMSLLSGLYATFTLFDFIFRSGYPRGYTSLIMAILFVGGLQLTVIGVIGEYIGHIFDEVKARPLYIIDELVRAPVDDCSFEQ